MEGRRCVLGMGARIAPQGGPGLAENRSRISAGPLRGAGQEEIAGTGTGGPRADPAAVARMKYEQENRTKPGTFRTATGFLRPEPDMSMAAKTGAPAMNAPKQNDPGQRADAGGAGAAGFNGDVTVAPVTNASTSATPAAGPTAARDGCRRRNEAPGDAAPGAAKQPHRSASTANSPAQIKRQEERTRRIRKQEEAIRLRPRARPRIGSEPGSGSETIT